MRRVFILLLFNAIILTINAGDTIPLSKGLQRSASEGLSSCCNRIYVGHIERYGSASISNIFAPKISGIEKLLGHYQNVNNIEHGHILFNDRPVYYLEKTEKSQDAIGMWYW